MKAQLVLGELEKAVLEYVWSVGEVDVKETHHAIGRERKITPNTVQSTLERLYRKDLLSRERVSHAFRYRARHTREEFRARAMASAAGDLSGAQAEGVLAAFVDVATRADHANLKRLESLIAAARTNRRAR